MLEQIWKEAVASTGKQPGKPVQGRANSALGQVAAAAGDGAVSLENEAPSEPANAKAAQTLRQMAAENPKAAWQKLQAEFDTQKLVWESLVMTKRGNKDDIAKIGAEVSHVLQAQQAGNAPQALELIDALLRAVDAGNNTLSSTMVKALRNVTAQHRSAQPRQQLAERLDTANIPATLPRTDADKQSLEAVLLACDLNDKALELDARRLLLLPLPEKPTREPFFAPVSYCGSKKLSDLVSNISNSGAPVAATMSNASRLSGFAPARPVGSKKSASLRGSSMGAVVGPTGSSMSVRSGVSEAVAESFTPKVAAAKLRSLAKEKPPYAWTKLSEEFSVQQLVWQSQLLTKTKYNDRISFQAKTEAIVAKLDDIINSRKASPDDAVSELDDFVKGLGEGSAVLNDPTVTACRNVVKQSRLVYERNQLAERLDTAHVAATLPRGALERRTLEDLVLMCEIEEPRLERSVREALGLAIPAELGAPVRKKKTASSMSAVSKRSSSTGAVTGPKLSAPAGAPASFGGGKAAFQPPPRILESI